MSRGLLDTDIGIVDFRFQIDDLKKINLAQRRQARKEGILDGFSCSGQAGQAGQAGGEPQ